MCFVLVVPALVSTTTPQSVCLYAFLSMHTYKCSSLPLKYTFRLKHPPLFLLSMAISVTPLSLQHALLPSLSSSYCWGGGKCHMLSDHGSVMLHSAACSFYDILILYLLLASVFWIAPDFLIFTCLVAQLVAFHSSHVFLFSVFLCLLPSSVLLFVCISSFCLSSLSFSLCPSQSFPLSNIKCPLLPPTQTLLLSTDSTELAHCHPPTPAWPPPLLPPPPPPLPLRRKRWGLLGTGPSSPPSSPPHSPQPFPQSRQE